MSASNKENLNRLKQLNEILVPIFGSQISQFGFTPIPNILLWNRAALKLNRTELIIWINLLSQALWEGKDFLAHPSVEEIAERIGSVEATVHTAKDGLIKKKMIELPSERNNRRTNFYDLRPGIEKINQFAGEKISQESAREPSAIDGESGGLNDGDTAGKERSTGS